MEDNRSHRLSWANFAAAVALYVCMYVCMYVCNYNEWRSDRVLVRLGLDGYFDRLAACS